MNKENILVIYMPHDIYSKTINHINTIIANGLRNKSITRLILDFSNTDFIDNAGTGFIISQYNIMQEKNGTCEIANPPSYIKTALRLTGIDKICRIIDNNEVLNAENIEYIICNDEPGDNHD